MLFQICYFLVRIRPFIQYKDTIKPSIPLENKLFFLIIVKNEYHQLHELITQLKQQSSLSPVITILDDHSGPEEIQKMKNIVHQFSDVKFLESTAKRGKKNAIYQFIQSTKEQVIVFLDADCRPSSINYPELASTKIQEADLVLGYAPFFKEKQIVNRLSRFDCMWIAAQYFGWAKIGDPYMGVGRNMVVKTKLYKEVLKEIRAKEIMSGDDDMLVQAIGNSGKIEIMTNPKTFMFSQAEENYASLLRQKTRQIGTSFYYKTRHKLLLGFSGMCSILVFPMILFFMLKVNVVVGSVLLLIKLIVSYLIFTPIARKLEENDLILFIPLWELVYGIHLAVLAIYGMFSKNQVWK